jgi:hypothetical protein
MGSSCPVSRSRCVEKPKTLRRADECSFKTDAGFSNTLLSLRFDVLVHAKEVLRVVLLLNGHEPLVVGTVGSFAPARHLSILSGQLAVFLAVRAEIRRNIPKDDSFYTKEQFQVTPKFAIMGVGNGIKKLAQAEN